MTDPFTTDSDRLNAIIDRLPKPTEMIVREWPDDYPGTFSSWAESVGHPRNAKGHCKTCGLAITCPFTAFWDALVSSVVRELDKHYRITQRGPARHLCVCSDSVHSGNACPTDCPVREGTSGKSFRERCLEKHRGELDKFMELPDEEPDLSHEDTESLYGRRPSYRCYVSRHEDCETGPGEPEEGCTCSCHPGPREKHCGSLGDHDPHGECWGNGPFRRMPEGARSPYRHPSVSSRTSEAMRAKCQPLEPGLKEQLFSAFAEDHEEDMKDPEYAREYTRVSDELKGQ